MSQPTIVIIDSNALCHRVKHTMRDLAYHEMRTGVIFGFMNYIVKYAKMLNTRRFVFGWDSGKSHRSRLFPDYKAKRKNGVLKRSPEEQELNALAYAQFHTLRLEVLPTLGFKNVFIQTGREADDIVASVINTLHRRFPTDKTVLVSSDQDLYQLLDRCDYLNPYDKKKRLFTARDFEKQYNIKPDQWALVKSLAGCDTDEVPGIPGVGETKAIQYITGKIVKGKVFDSITSEEGRNIISRNGWLVNLPLQGTQEFDIDFDEVFLLRNFYAICDAYGFSSFTRGLKLEEWKTHLGLE